MVAQRRDDSDRDELRRLVEDLPESEIPTAKKMLRFLREVGTQPIEYSLENAPIDDEPWTEEDEKAWQEAQEDIKRGDIVSYDELRRELGL